MQINIIRDLCTNGLGLLLSSNVKNFITLCLGLLLGIQPSVKYWLLAVEGQSGRSPLR